MARRCALINPLNGAALLDSENNPRSWILRGSDFGGAQFYSLPTVVVDDETMLVAANSGSLLKVDPVLVDVHADVST